MQRWIMASIFVGLVGVGVLSRPTCACVTPPPDIVNRFPAAGVKTVLLRAAAAETAKIDVATGLQNIEISGMPSGGAVGYHSPDPNYRETPAAEWGLEFVSARFGDVLVISTKNEIRFIHHRYTLDSLAVRVPPGVELIRERRELTHEGKPDLSPPKPRTR